MCREVLAGGVATEAVRHVVHAGGQSHLGEDLREKSGSGRRLLAGLDHHGVAARECGRHLPGQQEQWEVPRHDHRDHAERFADRVVERLPTAGKVGHERLLAGGGCDVGERPKVGQRSSHVELSCLGDRLTGVGHLGGDELLEALLDAIRGAAQQRGAFAHRRVGPAVVEGPTGGVHGAIDQRLVCLVDLAEYPSGRRVDVIESAPRIGIDECAVDEVTDPAVGG